MNTGAAADTTPGARGSEPRPGDRPCSGASADGALWIAEHAADKIERMTLDGVVTRSFRLRRGAPDGLAIGPDGALWFPEGIPCRIGRLAVPLC